MASLSHEERQRLAGMREELSALPLPPIEFHVESGVAARPGVSTVFFALRRQHLWRRLAATIASMAGIAPPPRDRLFHMSVWNSNNGNPYQSIGDIRVEDFPHDVE